MELHIKIPQTSDTVEPTTATIEFSPSSETLAAEFWGMSAEEQSYFFNHLGKITPPGQWAFQCQTIAESRKLDKNGEKIINHLYNFLNETFG
jgi:hypothetical protein